ncbi:hypothetical protein [Sphaerotilus mobilis]|uniref:Calcineurin-like phosphoesterase family protein n=1 Tax=Sphaerotilus mobilis TaxID=47994 RepID=A0A4Q7LGC0_9BURK|nr:hypothetical protein [Sphaerotilus mobilis]RZS53132.1 hypothetical protein EV685_2755 [Sphaerotilus mobilis]
MTFTLARPLTRLAVIAAPLLLAGLSGCAGMAERHAQHHGAQAPAGTYSFGLWGDMPYLRNGDAAKLPAVLDSINRADIAFSIYNGDIKDGASRCDDKVYTEALAMFNGMKQPVVYLPGDNEWTDCHRSNNGGFDALERLAHLRRVMYPTLDSLGAKTMPLTHQGRAPGDKAIENVRFSQGPVLFVGLNVPGSNNNLVLNAQECSDKSVRKAAQCDAANAEFLERDAANIAWLNQSFDQARSQKARGIVVTVQGDPGFDLPETPAVDESLLPGNSGYRSFMTELARLTAAFDGQVLFVHGDTHFFKVDKPLHAPNKMLENFTRIQTFGSPSLHWVKVTVEPTSANLFRIEPVMVAQKK